jgi:hypothetical protein
VLCALERGGTGGRQRAETVEAGGSRESRGGALGVRYSGMWATPGERAPAGEEGRWDGPREIVPGSGGKLIQIQNFKQIQINSNLSKLDRFKKDLPLLKKIEIKMVMKGLKRGTTFYIGTSSYSKLISNKNLENFLGLNLKRI